MGHVRLGRLPRTRLWQEVVALFGTGVPLDQIAGPTARASESALGAAHNDPALGYAYWLLTQIPMAARQRKECVLAQCLQDKHRAAIPITGPVLLVSNVYANCAPSRFSFVIIWGNRPIGSLRLSVPAAKILLHRIRKV
jgi:hypothetical protein